MCKSKLTSNTLEGTVQLEACNAARHVPMPTIPNRAAVPGTQPTNPPWIADAASGGHQQLLAGQLVVIR